MNTVWLALPIIAALGALAWLTIWSRVDSWARPAAVLLFLVSIPVVAWAGVESLGRHKPVSFAWLAAGDYHVLAAVMRQDRSIFIYLIDPERDEPRPLVLPWSNEAAQAIQEALDGAPEGQEGGFMMSYKPDAQRAETQFHALPQPPMPPAKDAPEPGLTYVPSEGD